MNKRLTYTVVGSLVGTIIEWYDYVLYGTASALIFNQIFFSDVSGPVGTLLAFATFAVGFVVRPVGGVIFGMLGDRIGRKRVLVLTILIMGTATALMGLAPTYDAVGYWAPVILVLLRIVQGIGSGSEYAGAVITVAESAPVKQRGLYASIPYIGVSIGLALSSFVFGLFQKLPEDVFLAWGWRIPFLFSIVLVIVALVVRMKMEETPVFERLKASHQRVRRPLVSAFRKSPRGIIVSWMVATTDSSAAYLFQTYLVAYVVGELLVPQSLMLHTLTVVGIVQLVTTPFFGWLSDKIGRKTVLMSAAVAMALFAFPLFWLLDTRNPALIILAIILGSGVFRVAISAVQASWMTELFESSVRYTSFAVGREWPTIFAGIVPVLGSAILIWTGGEPWGIALLIIFFGVLVFVGVLLSPNNSKLELDQIGNDEHGGIGVLAPSEATEEPRT